MDILNKQRACSRYFSNNLGGNTPCLVKYFLPCHIFHYQNFLLMAGIIPGSILRHPLRHTVLVTKAIDKCTTSISDRMVKATLEF